MPSSLSPKPVRRVAKKSVPVSVPQNEPQIKTMPMAKHHGLLVGNIILVFLVIGCLSAAFLMSEKMKTAVFFANDAAARLAASEKDKSELEEQLRNIKVLNNLANKITVPVASSSEIIWNTYESPNLLFKYPEGYTVTKEKSIPFFTIKGEKGRIEIFRMKDFGDRPFGFEDGDMTRAEFDQYVPQKMITTPANQKVEPYNVWIFYGIDDSATKALLEEVVSSIKVIK